MRELWSFLVEYTDIYYGAQISTSEFPSGKYTNLFMWYLLINIDIDFEVT